MNDLEVDMIEGGKVRLTMLRKDQWGRVKERKQYTFTRRQFERALNQATITVPWRNAKEIA